MRWIQNIRKNDAANKNQNSIANNDTNNVANGTANRTQQNDPGGWKSDSAGVTFRLEERIMTVLAWVHSVILLIGTYLPGAGIFKMSPQETLHYFFRGFLLLIPVIASWFMIRKINSLLLYILGSVLITVLLGVITRCPQTMILSTIILIIRCCPRISKGNQIQDMPGEAVVLEAWEIPTVLDRPGIVCGVFLIILYFVLIFQKNGWMLGIILYLLAVEVIITYVYGILSRLDEFVSSNHRIANMPVKAMQRTTYAILLVTFFLLMLFLLPSILYGREPLTGITEFRPNLEFEVPVEEGQMAMPEDGMAEMLAELGTGEIKELPGWLKALMDVIAYGLVVLCLMGAAVLVYQCCRKMLHSYAQGHGSDEVILLEEMQGDENSYLKKGRERFRRGNPNQRIRREYRKTILKYSKTRPFGWETPEELETCISDALVLESGGTEFHDIYEKARYDQWECSQEELELFMRAKKKGKKQK